MIMPNALRRALLTLLTAVPAFAAPVAVNDTFTGSEDSPVSPDGQPALSVNFNAGADGFSYVDDPFGTNAANNESGSHEAAGGFNSTGGLQVRVGNRPGNNGGLRQSSGGWERTFTLPAAGTIQFSGRYRLQTEGGMEDNEYAYLMLDVDGTRYGPSGTAPALYITRLAGPNTENSANGATSDSGWQTFTQNVTLTAGSHTLTLGLYNNNSTAFGEVAQLNLDDLVIGPPPGSGSVLQNDTGGTGTVTATKMSDPEFGTVSFQSNGGFTYTPQANYFGVDSFTYRASDSTGNSNTATITLNITPVNDAPAGTPDTYTTAEDTALTVNPPGVLANDSDVDNAPATLTATGATQPANGTLTGNGNGGFIYTPRLNFTGSDSFTYQVSDGALQSSQVPVNITVTAVPDAPQPAADTYYTPSGSALIITQPAQQTGTNVTFITAAPETANGGTAQPGDTWRYLDDGSDQGTAWRSLEFNDSAWKSGRGEFGYGDAAGEDRPEFTVIEDNATPGYNGGDSNRYATTWFRKTFTVADYRRLSGLTMSLLRDDGAVVWLNGERVYFENGLANATYQTFTAGTIGNEVTHDSIPLPDAAQYLQDGDNVLAVEIHQQSASSSDLSFDLGLTAVDRPYSGVLANDVEPEGQPMTATLVQQPAHGTLTFNANGTFTYNATAGYQGEDTFTYTATDGSLTSPPATVTITVGAPFNQPPVAQTNNYNGTEDIVLTVPASNGVLANDTDPEGQPLTAIIVAQPANGTVSLAANGSFSFTPALNWNGTTSFTYRASDGIKTSPITAVTLNVASVPDVPLPAADTYRTNVGTPLVVTSTAPGTTNPITIITAAPETTGGVAQPGDVWKFLDNGSDQGTAWQATDFDDSAWLEGAGELGYGDTQDGRPEVTVVSYGTNASAKYITTYFRKSFSIADRLRVSNLAISLLRDDEAVVYLNGNRIHADPTLAGASPLTYTTLAGNQSNEATHDAIALPGAAQFLQDGLNVIAVEVHQNAGTSSDVSFDLGLTADEAGYAGVLYNDSDPEGNPFTATIATQPANGAVVMNANGTFTYTPNAGFSGTDTFSYRATDATGPSLPATVSVLVSSGANQKPLANADTYAPVEDATFTRTAAQGVLANDTDPDGDTMTAVLSTTTARGALTFSADGSFTYTPQADYSGTDSFTYRARDSSNQLSTAATVTLNVAPANDAPVAAADSYGTDPGVVLIVPPAQSVLLNDTDIDGDSLTAQVVTPPASGALNLNADGTFTYNPAAPGTFTFTYAAHDGTVQSPPATVTLIVNGRPLAGSDAFSTSEDVPLVRTAPGVMSNDSDPENSPLTAIVVTQPASGALNFSADGSFSYAPNANYFGSDSFTYTVSDGTRTSLPATVSLTITAVNDAPVAQGDNYTYFAGTVLSINTARGLLANDSDIEGAALTTIKLTDPVSGALVLNSDGSFTYTPQPGFTGSDSFTYRVSDGALNSATATVSLALEQGENVVINEILYRPGTTFPENPALEFIELHNRGANAIPLTGWSISSGVTYAFPAGTSIPAGGYLAVAANVAQFQATYPGVTNVVGGWTGSLSNGGEKIKLTDAGGNDQDEVSYASEGDWATRVRESTWGGWDWSTPADGGGRSLELRNPRLSNDNGQNWTPSTAVRGTPGAANGALTANIAPVIKAVKHSPAVPTPTDRVRISCELNDESPFSALNASLFWREATTTTPGAFQEIVMSQDGEGEWFAQLEPLANLAIVEFYLSATDGVNTRTWPAPTSEGQNANCQYQVSSEAVSSTAGMYRLTLTAAENNAFNNVNSGSDRQFNHTLIIQRGAETEIRYLCDFRIRGNSSRSYQFRPLRVNIPADDDLGGSTRFNLNPRSSHLQHLGMRLMQAAGLRAPDTIPVELRRNGVESTTSGGSTPDYGLWVRMEDLSGEMVNDKWPLTDGGGIYKKGRPDQYWRSTGGVPNNPDGAYDGFLKQNNSDANDWSDLSQFFTAWQAASAPHFPGSNAGDVAGSGGSATSGNGNWDGTAFTAAEIASVETVADLDQWARWFAVMTLLQSNETNASNGQDDDYGCYFEPRTAGAVTQRRFQFLPHDLDTIFGLGDSGLNFNSRGLYDMTDDGSVFRPLLPLFGNNGTAGNAAFRTKYFNALRELIGTVFDADTTTNPNPPFYQFVDHHLGNWAPAANRTAIKDFVRQRGAYLLGLIGSSATAPPAGTSSATLTAAHGPLFISEVLAHNVAVHNNAGTFPDVIELQNTGASAVSLAGMSLTDDPLVKAKYVLPATATIAAGARLVISASSTATPGLNTGFGLNNSGGTLHLYNTIAAGQTLVDSITYGLQAPDLSIGRTGAALDVWALCTPTIGTANTAVAALAAPAGLRINEWLGNADYRAAQDFIELYNPAAQPVALGGMSLTDDFINYPQRHLLPPLSFMAAGAFVEFTAEGSDATPGDARELPFNIGSSTGSVALLGANGSLVDRGDTLPQFRDVSLGRVPDGTGPFAPLAPPSPGAANTPLPAGALDVLNFLRITELMYNPALSTQSEFIEFRNTSTSAELDLSGVTFKNGITYTFPAGSFLEPGSFIVLVENAARFTAQFPGVPIGGIYTGRLDNGGERLRFDLPGRDLAILDFNYADGWYPSTDGGGDSLQIANALASPAMWDRSEGWQAGAPNPGSLPPYSVYAGPDMTVAAGVPVFLDGALIPGTHTPSTVALAWTKDSGPGTVTFTTANCEDANAVFSASGIYVLRLTATAPGPVTVTDLVTVAVPESYDAWAARMLPSATAAQRAPAADPDHDGLNNLAEHVLGGNPTLSDASSLTTLVPGDYLTLEYRRPLTVDPAIQVIPQITSDLAVWDEGSSNVLHERLSSAGGVETWRARDVLPFIPGQHRCLRLKIVMP